VSRNLGQRDSPMKRIAANQQGIQNEEQKPVLGGPQIFVGDYVGPGDPGNDPEFTSESSPPWLNWFTWLTDYPVCFAHGVDGETDMGGMYDLVTGSPVSGTIAFMMPNEWALQAPPSHPFVVLIDGTGSPENWVYAIAAQIIDPNDPDATVSDVPVRVYWPICADLCVT
jgi:hypothetical protein